MDRTTNPYTPNAGAQPRFLAGRGKEVEDFRVLLARLQRGSTEKSMLVTGLRGVGKTALLGEFDRIAREQGWTAVDSEVSSTTPFGPTMANLARRALLRVSPKARWGERARSAAGVLTSFSLTVRPDGSLAGGLDVAPATGAGDSGDVGEDLADVFEAIGGAAQERGTGVVFLIDEIQFLAKDELEALIGAVHRSVRRSLPVTLAGAGLPQLPGLASEAKSYAERLFRFPMIGELPRTAATQALVEPALSEGVSFETRAVEHVLAYTEGYPYFLQEHGRAAWDLAAGPRTITAADAIDAQDVVEAELDESFFRARVQRSTREELRYLRAMGELGPGEQRAGDVAGVLGRTSDQVSPLRTRLVAKGLLWTPRYGHVRFTVPQFDRFMRRFMDVDDAPRT